MTPFIIRIYNLFSQAASKVWNTNTITKMDMPSVLQRRQAFIHKWLNGFSREITSEIINTVRRLFRRHLWCYLVESWAFERWAFEGFFLSWCSCCRRQQDLLFWWCCFFSFGVNFPASSSAAMSKSKCSLQSSNFNPAFLAFSAAATNGSTNQCYSSSFQFNGKWWHRLTSKTKVSGYTHGSKNQIKPNSSCISDEMITYFSNAFPTSFFDVSFEVTRASPFPNRCWSLQWVPNFCIPSFYEMSPVTITSKLLMYSLTVVSIFCRWLWVFSFIIFCSVICHCHLVKAKNI
jgi:hypothetical protein